MKKDIGFWGIDGVYIPDVQEVNEMEIDKYFNDLNDIVRDAFEPTAEEIIIDGVDVAGCDWYFEPNGNCDNEQLVHKCEGDNCYYKQLKRLEQENAELKAEVDKLNKSNQELCEDNLNLSAENEQLIEGLGIANKYVNKYHQTLQEIKEIIEDCNNGKCFSCEYNMEDAENCIDYRHNKILDLITKAEEE